jgi:D-alanine-D-alanine ligase
MDEHVGVLMGGWGEEREIAMKTGEAVASALERGGHRVTRILCGPGLAQTLRSSGVEVVFNALHGRVGEDGRVQGLLEVLGLPYTGSGVLASALAMNKPFAKKLFRLHNLPTPHGYCVAPADAHRASALHADVGFPCVVKPACGGSSVGLSVVHDEGALEAAVRKASRCGGQALIERLVRGRELTVGIVGDEVLGSCEISFEGETFDYARKYQRGARYHLPPRLSPTRRANIEALALAAYRALGCRGYARIDFLASDTDNDVLLEVNTLPGLTASSLLPKIAAHQGLGFDALVERILAQATLDAVEVAPREEADDRAWADRPLQAG